MPTVNSNTAAQFALNKLNGTERDMQTAMERLSSGKRINHAGDDAAGAAIADRMTAQIRGLEQSVRNAADVISMAQVTEGALDESSSIIQRIRELAIQSASDTYNGEERAYIDAEVDQLLAELDRVTRDTTFNEIAVLDGSFADRMTAQIRGLEQSVRNAADVISMAQVTEGALDESSSIIQRIRELAIQSASDSYNAEERSYIDAEVDQLLAELDRVTRDTTFNEIAVLDGSFADRRFQIGTHEREFAQLSISSMRLDSLGAYKAKSQGTETTDVANSAVDNDNLALNAYAVADTSETNLVQAESFTIHGILGSSSVTAAAGSNIRDIATSVNAVFDSTGVSAVASTQLKLQAKTLDDEYNGQTSLSFSIQGKNTTAITVAANVTLNNNEGSSVLSELRDSINNYTTTTGVTATLSTDKSSIIMVQNEGYDIKLGDVNFSGDSTTTGSRRTLLVTSLDNDEVVAGDAVSLGDTNVTTTDADGIYTGTPSGILTIGGRVGTTNPTAFTGSGPGSTTDANAIVTTQALDSFGANNLTLVDATQTINSFLTITGDAAFASNFTITGTDVYGNAQSEVLAGGGSASTVQSANIYGTVTSIAVSASVAADITVGKLNTIANQSALVTITSSASDESGKTFTVTGTDMSGNALIEVITGPEANKTVTGRRIFKTIHTVVNSAATTGAITVGVKAADSVIVTGQLEMVSSNSFTVIGEDGKGLFEASPGAASLDKLSGVSLLSRQSSVDALRVLDRSLDRIHKERAKLGALMSRMEKAIDNLSNVALNTDTSRGRIEDADFAKESARMTKAQILQQSAMAMIAQAGKAQQNVLQLLQN
jgi:flagellin